MLYALQCPECGRWQGISTKDIRIYVLKCRACNRNSKAKGQSLGLRLNHRGPFISERQLIYEVQKLNKGG